MEPFAFIASVAQQCFKLLMLQCIVHCPISLNVIRLRATVYYYAENQMISGIAKCRKLWITPFFMGFVMTATFCVIA